MASNNTNLTSLNKYSDELKDDVKISEQSLREKSLIVGSLHAKWLCYLYTEKENLEKLTSLKKKLINKQLNLNENKSVLRLKSETLIEQGDENIIKINKLMKNTTDCIDFIERALVVISNLGYNIKNIIEIIKLQIQ